ncbi:MAG TPA: hypothetical protein VNL98_00380 [Gemmatimonadales bacterium]|nr:hypothetical protein [Gemmatimonadales bacterium]
MTEVTFLPWLGLRESVQVAGVTLVPWGEFQASPGLAAPDRDWLGRYFARYQRRGGTAVDTATVVVPREGGLAKALRVLRAAAASCLVWEHAGALSRGNPTMCPPRGERWLVLTQRYDPANEFVALREGYTTNVWSLDEFVEVEPLSAGATVARLDPPVIGMAEALVAHTEQDEEFGAALDLLVEGTMTSDRHLERLNFVFLGSALELLAQAGGERQKAVRIAEALACAVRNARNGCPTAADAWERAATAARRADPELVRVWMAGCDPCDRGSCGRHQQRHTGFYRRRNRVIHEGRAGGDLLLHQRPDTGEPHSWQMQVGGGGGAHACDIALVMSGWLLLDRVGGLLERTTWSRWCHALDGAAGALGFQ